MADQILRAKDDLGNVRDLAVAVGDEFGVRVGGELVEEIRTVLTSMLAELSQKLEAGQQVALDASTLAALENISAVVSGTVNIGTIDSTVDVAGTITVSGGATEVTAASVLDRLTSILAELDAGISINNFPSETALPTAQVTSLKDVSDRAGRQLGTVSLDSTTLAALENITTKLSLGGSDVSGINPLPVSAIFADALGVPYSDINPVPVDVGGSIQIDNLTVGFESVVSTLNSRSTPLDADELFIGTWEDVLGYAAITAAIFTDVNSAENGAVVQFSADGVDVITQQTATVTGGYGGFFSFAPQARYFRIIYTNGPVAQTVLEVEVGYQFNAPAVGQAPIGGLTTDADVAQLVQNVNMGRHPYGFWVPMLVDENGIQNVSVSSIPSGTTTILNSLAKEDTISTKFGGGKTTSALRISSSGDNVIITPPSGQRVKLFWLGMSSPESNGAEVIAEVKFGANVHYRWNMGSPGAFSHWEIIEGATDVPLVVNLSAGEAVDVNVTYIVI